MAMKLAILVQKAKFIGGKLTIALDYDTCQPLTMLFHPGAVHDSKIYLEILCRT